MYPNRHNESIVPGLPPPDILAAYIIVIFLAIGLHEYAHCKVADAAGDPTPALHGRVTLNLTKHFELSGTIMMFITALSGYGLGWGKAAPINPSKMRNPRWDLFYTVSAGPLSNILQAAVWAMAFRLVMAVAPQLIEQSDFVSALLFFGIRTNLALAFFNLIPFGPLDGHWIVGTFLPEKQRYYWYRFNRQIGMIGLFVAIFVFQAIRNNGGPDVLGLFLDKPINFMFRLLTGINLPL